MNKEKKEKTKDSAMEPLKNTKTRKQVVKKKLMNKKTKEPKIHFSKYINNDEVRIKDIFIPMLRVMFGSELNTAKNWKKKVEEELHRELE